MRKKKDEKCEIEWQMQTKEDKKDFYKKKSLEKKRKKSKTSRKKEIDDYETETPHKCYYSIVKSYDCVYSSIIPNNNTKKKELFVCKQLASGFCIYS